MGLGPPAAPWPMAIQTQEQMKQTHGHLKNYTAVARATTSSSRVLGGGWPGWWLHPRHPRNAVVDHVSTSPCGQAPSPTATAGTCQAALPRPSVLPGAALIACANKQSLGMWQNKSRGVAPRRSDLSDSSDSPSVERGLRLLDSSTPRLNGRGRLWSDPDDPAPHEFERRHLL